jgi:hypothetical protein
MNKSIRVRGGLLFGEPFDVTFNFTDKNMKDLKEQAKEYRRKVVKMLKEL